MKKVPRERSKSLGHILLQPTEFKKEATIKDGTDLRSVCRRVAPYIVQHWRDVCDELGVSEDRLDELMIDYDSAKRSELAYQGLCSWIETAGRFASTDKLLKAVRACGLRRAEAHFKRATQNGPFFSTTTCRRLHSTSLTDEQNENLPKDELTSVQEKKQVPCFAKPPAIDSLVKDTSVNKQAKQKAAADRLARPKSRHSDSSEQKTPKSQLKRRPSFISDNRNPLLIRPATTKQTDLCKMKIKVSINGVLRKDTEEVESTRDTFASTKDDYKHICHTFVRLVMANQQSHFNQLKHRLGFKGIAVIGLDKVGFNIFLVVVCFNLGALEIVLQSHHTGRLKRIVHSCLVTQPYLDSLGVADLDIAVSIEEDVVNRNREAIISRNITADVADHPIEAIEVCKYLLDHDETQYDTPDTNLEQIYSLEIRSWHEQLKKDVDTINSRLRAFLSRVNDFLLILRILKPAEKSVINCLQDVLECLHRIKSTKHLNEGTHLSVVEEYLAIVNQIRLKVQYIHRYECALVFHDTMNDTSNELFQCHLHDLDEMLEPMFEFQLVINQMEIHEPGLTLQTLFKEIALEDDTNVSISSLERDAYCGCLCYIPSLVGKLLKLSDVIGNAVTHSTGHSTRHVTVLGESVGGEMATPKSLMTVNMGDTRLEQGVT